MPSSPSLPRRTSSNRFTYLLVGLGVILLVSTWFSTVARSRFMLSRAGGSLRLVKSRIEPLHPVITREQFPKPTENPVERVRLKVDNMSNESIATAAEAGTADEGTTYVPPEHQIESKPKEAGRVHIFYYSWWGTPDGPIEKAYAHWNHEVLGHWTAQVNEQYKGLVGKILQPPEEIGANFYPQGGPYSSSDPETIKRHAKQMKQAGGDVVVLSWYPPQKSDSNGVPELADKLVPLLLDTFKEHDLQLAFHIEPYQGRTAKSVWDDAEYIILKYGMHPALAKVKGLPLLYIYDSYLVNPTEWQWVSTNKPKNAFVLGLVVESRHLQELSQTNYFDGFFTYFAANGFVWGSSRSNWNTITDYAHQHGMVTSISVGPGYEDTRIRPWNGVNSRPRNNGMYYSESVAAAASSQPEYISITSFNEWHEGTQIEPAIQKPGYLDYGPDPEMYLTLTSDLVKRYFPPQPDSL